MPDQEDPSQAFDLSRFVAAQAKGVYAGALRELRQGEKRTHWMWFVFPQLAGLGRSDKARHFAISGAPEARSYLAHPVLGARLVECARVLTGLTADDPVSVFGPVDAQKLRSSMTLFAHAATAPETRTVFQDVLDHYFAGQDDAETTRRL